MPFDPIPIKWLTREETRDLDVLLYVRERIAKDGGWLQGEAGRVKAHCIMTWIANGASANWDIETVPRVVKRLVAILDPRSLAPADTLVDYNDDDGRTQADMVALVDAGIAKLREG